jgi:hypothetical protein
MEPASTFNLCMPDDPMMPGASNSRSRDYKTSINQLSYHKGSIGLVLL